MNKAIWALISLVFVACQYMGSFQIQYSTEIDLENEIMTNIEHKYKLRKDTNKSKIKNTEYLLAAGYDSINEHVGYFIVKRMINNRNYIDGYFRTYGPNETTNEFKNIEKDLIALFKRNYPDSIYQIIEKGKDPWEPFEFIN